MRHEGHLEFTVKELRFFKSVGLQREIPKFLFTRHEITHSPFVLSASFEEACRRTIYASAATEMQSGGCCKTKSGDT